MSNGATTSSNFYYLFIKSKTNNKTAQGSNTVFIFNSELTAFRHIFQRNQLLRFRERTQVYKYTYEQLRSFLFNWIYSKQNGDKLSNSCLPYPNTKIYVWNDPYINYALYGNPNAVNADPERASQYNLTAIQLKEKMVHELFSTNSEAFVVEITNETLKNIDMRCIVCHFSVSETINNQSKMNEIFYSNDFQNALCSQNILNAIRLFSENIHIYTVQTILMQSSDNQSYANHNQQMNNNQYCTEKTTNQNENMFDYNYDSFIHEEDNHLSELSELPELPEYNINQFR